MTPMHELRVRITLIDEMLGMMPSNPDVHEKFILSKAPDAPTRAEEIEALGVDEVVEMGKTVFPRLEDGTPFIYDYQIKGMLKDSVGMLKRVSGTKCSGIKAHKKIIDGIVFVDQRKIPIKMAGGIGNCQRPLRASTAQGERTALANSEAVPEGSVIEFSFLCMNKSDFGWIKECLDYGKLRGLGQWRNSGKGRFTWEEIKTK